jgi:hypothetical protein
MTALLEIQAKNPDPVLASDIANGIAWSYRLVKQKEYQETLGERGTAELPRAVLVLDPARPELQSGSRDTWVILPAWACGVALLLWAVFLRLLPKPAHY